MVTKQSKTTASSRIGPKPGLGVVRVRQLGSQSSSRACTMRDGWNFTNSSKAENALFVFFRLDRFSSVNECRLHLGTCKSTHWRHPNNVETLDRKSFCLQQWGSGEQNENNASLQGKCARVGRREGLGWEMKEEITQNNYFLFFSLFWTRRLSLVENNVM